MDRNTFTKLVLEAENTLYHVAKTILSSDCDCEDAVQEAILVGYEKLNTLRQPQYFRTWLVRILINECYRIHRANRPVVYLEEYLQTEPCDDTPPPDTDLYHAIRDLPEPLRLPVVLYYIEGYSVREIHEVMGIPGGTVKSRLSRARKALKLSLESEDI